MRVKLKCATILASMKLGAFVVSPAWMALSFLIAAAHFVGNRFHQDGREPGFVPARATRAGQ